NIGTLILLSAITAAIIGVAVGLVVTGGKSASRGNTTTTSAGVPPSSTPTSSTPASSTTSSVPTSTFPVPSTLPLTTAAVASTCPAAGSTKRVVWFSKAPP